MKKYIKLALFPILIMAVALVDFTPRVYRQGANPNLSTAFKSAMKTVRNGDFVNQAYALSVMGLANEAQRGSLVRYFYYLINTGPPGGDWSVIGGAGGPEDDDGDATGFIGIVNMITGPSALGGGLSASGYSDCSDIPATGSANMADGGDTYTMIFGTPAQTIPAGYTGAGGNYAKRVTVEFNGATFMDVEFNCSDTSGWMRFNEPGVTPARSIEIYYDTTNASSVKAEVAMTYAATPTERFLAKFAMNSATEYEIWITMTSDSPYGFRTAIRGDTGSGDVNVFIQYDLDAPDVLDTGVTGDGIFWNQGDVECLTMAANTDAVAAAGGACAALTLSAAGAPIIDGGGDFSINWTEGTLPGSLTVLP